LFFCFCFCFCFLFSVFLFFVFSFCPNCTAFRANLIGIVYQQLHPYSNRCAGVPETVLDGHRWNVSTVVWWVAVVGRLRHLRPGSGINKYGRGVGGYWLVDSGKYVDSNTLARRLPHTHTRTHTHTHTRTHTRTHTHAHTHTPTHTHTQAPPQGPHCERQQRQHDQAMGSQGRTIRHDIFYSVALEYCILTFNTI
jgi:hypothetical protein